MIKYLIYWILVMSSQEVQVCDLDQVCLKDYWIATSPITEVDEDCEFRIKIDETDSTITLTNADLVGDNPCIEFDNYGCGIVTIEMRCKDPECNCYGRWVSRKFRQCCLEADVICNE